MEDGIAKPYLPEGRCPKSLPGTPEGRSCYCPLEVGYGAIAIDAESLDRIFMAKKLRPHKRHAMIGTYALHCEIHDLLPY